MEKCYIVTKINATSEATKNKIDNGKSKDKARLSLNKITQNSVEKS